MKSRWIRLAMLSMLMVAVMAVSQAGAYTVDLGKAIPGLPAAHNVATLDITGMAVIRGVNTPAGVCGGGVCTTDVVFSVNNFLSVGGGNVNPPGLNNQYEVTGTIKGIPTQVVPVGGQPLAFLNFLPGGNLTVYVQKAVNANFNTVTGFSDPGSVAFINNTVNQASLFNSYTFVSGGNSAPHGQGTAAITFGPPVNQPQAPPVVSPDPQEVRISNIGLQLCRSATFPGQICPAGVGANELGPYNYDEPPVGPIPPPVQPAPPAGTIIVPPPSPDWVFDFVAVAAFFPPPPTPEPMSLLLLGSGLVGAAGFLGIRRRMKS